MSATDMNLAAAVQAQMLQSLLQAMQASDAGLKAGATLRAVFAGWATPDGKAPPEGEQAPAQALVAGRPVTLLLAADAARSAALRPGAAMTLVLDEAPAGDRPAQARLAAVAPPPSDVSGRSDAARTARSDALLQPASTPAADPKLAAGLAARAAAGPVVGAALARQDSLAPLFANLAALGRAAEDPSLARQMAALPPGLAQAARQALRQALPLEAATPDALKQAVARSGVFHEAQLARGQPALAAGDLKSALVALKALLGAAAEASPERSGPAERDGAPRGAAPPREASAQAPAASQPRLAPPLRDGAPLAQAEAAPDIDFAAERPSAIVARLSEQSSAALDRLSLGQFASLPAPQDAATLQNRWFVELPLAPGSGAGVLPLEIEEDRSGGGQAGEAQGKLWRVRFALDLEPMGLIHALVTMQGRAVSVAVWAERETTSRLVRDFAPDLEAALKEADFDEAAIDVVLGRPAARPATAGAFLDRAS